MPTDHFATTWHSVCGNFKFCVLERSRILKKKKKFLSACSWLNCKGRIQGCRGPTVFCLPETLSWRQGTSCHQYRGENIVGAEYLILLAQQDRSQGCEWLCEKA